MKNFLFLIRSYEISVEVLGLSFNSFTNKTLRDDFTKNVNQLKRTYTANGMVSDTGISIAAGSVSADVFMMLVDGEFKLRPES